MRNFILYILRYSVPQPIYNLIRQFYHYLLKLTRPLITKKHSLNLGGGPGFSALGWLNLEEVVSVKNPYPFKFTPHCRLPVKSTSMKTVYTSHFLEHVDSETAHRILEEVLRVLIGYGEFIIKLPDYDRALDSWRNNDTAFLDDNSWGIEELTRTWKSRDIKDCLDYKYAAMFCSFWNDEYGDHFSGQISKDKFAYFGPPATSIEFLRDLIKNHTPSEITKKLCKEVFNREKSYHFCHRNAWSGEELEKLLISHSFRVITFNKNSILARCSDVPGITEMQNISMYCLARKA